MAEEEIQEIEERDFHAHGRPLKTVTSFKYMERILTEVDNDWPTEAGNLKKAQKSWERLTRILGQDGDNPRVSGVFFKAVKQAVLILG